MPQLHKSIQVLAIDDVISEMGRLDITALTYPSADLDEAVSRIMELKRLGATALYLQVGDDKLLPIIVGKGFRGVVVRCRSGPYEAVVKMPRLDSPKMDMAGEARYQVIASSLGLAPTVYGWSGLMILMEFIDGIKLGECVKTISQDEVEAVLEACFQLDRLGLDHGQLSDASHHIILRDKKPVIIDYGHASTERRARNLTSLISYLLNRLQINPNNHSRLLTLLSKYSRSHDLETYRMIKDYVIGILQR